ncbi:SMC-Scp complex subunit ScpB [Peptoniphilus sp. oral taxon 386]|uniref:SMC-Scp complex subunit ScpB n=1 Tax=Peptoniphilus sp. oral taxon 386 TaxID=652713 RepID=UPI0002FD0FCC|nr:SMC-Scp complex subunit ScpB [Peptoniphilus sp. oral taxon 386]
MEDEKIISIIEGILFAWAEPVSVIELSKVIGQSQNKIRGLLQIIKEKYEKADSGLRLVILNDSYQISTKPENYDYISEFVSGKNKKNLSNAALETLSIIAYKQPVTKLEVEEIRGVKCDSTIKALSELGLIEISGQLEKIGRPNIYITTDEFLKKFGLSSLEELPEIEEDEQIKMTFLEE